MTGITFETTAEDAATRALQVTVAEDRLADAERRAVREYARTARLPGFRKGHAPEPVVRRRFESEIRRWVLEEALRESWQTIIKEQQLKPTGDPQVRNVSFEAGKPLTFELLVEVHPEITLAKVAGFTARRSVPPVTDEMVAEQLQRLREQRGTWTPISGARAKPGNLVTVTVAPLDAEAESAPHPHDIVLGQGEAIPDLEARIMELDPGQTTETQVRFSDDHSDPSRRGQTRQVRVTLHEIKEQALPDLDDNLARELGDFDSLDALHQRVRDDLVAEANRDADSEVRADLLRQIADANQVPAPPSLVHRLLHGYAESYRVEQSQFETFATQFRPVAEAQVKRELVLDSVATAQNLRVTEAEIDERIARIAASRGSEPGKVYSSLQQQGRLGDLERAITEEKVLAWLLQQSTVTEDTP